MTVIVHSFQTILSALAPSRCALAAPAYMLLDLQCAQGSASSNNLSAYWGRHSVAVSAYSSKPSVASLLDGTGSFLPLGTPTVQTSRTCALVSRRELRARRVPRPRLLERGPSRIDSRCPTKKWTRRHKMTHDFHCFFESCKLAAFTRCYIAHYIAAVLHHTFRMSRLHRMLHSSAISHLPADLPAVI